MRGILARTFQILGLVLLPVGLVLGAAHDDVRTELVLMAVGGLLFAVGKLVLEPKT